MVGNTSWWLPAAMMALQILALAALTEASVMALLGKDRYSHSATSLGISTLASMGLLWLAQRIHKLRQIDLPLPWREGKKGDGGAWDGTIRNVLKSFLTLQLVLVLPWQGSIIAASLVWQFALHYGGFGGGRPGGITTTTPPKLEFMKRFWQKVEKASESIAPYILNDVKNASYLPVIFGLAVYTPTLFFIFMRMHMARGDAGLSIGMAYLYRVLQMGPYFKFFAHAAVMVHKEGHGNKNKGLFKGPLSPILNHICEWWLAFFYGHTPENYRVGHVEVHHGEGNNHGDASSTLYLDRSKSSSFLRYMGDFAEFWMGFAVVEYFDQRLRLNKSGDVTRDTRSRNRQLVGILAFYAVFIGLAIMVDPVFAIVYFWVPHLEIINYLAAINYTWHTFVDPDDPDNEYIKSITILDGHYPLFGEDFHVEHHLRPGLHWSKSHGAFESHIKDYTENKATVFKDTMEFELFFLILLKDHDKLAEHFVDLSDSFPTHEAKVAELRRRMKAVPRID